jgi:hypothetical protein
MNINFYKICFFYCSVCLWAGCGADNKQQTNSNGGSPSSQEVKNFVPPKPPPKRIVRDELFEKISRIPVAKTENQTRFAIHKINERTGSNDLVANPYVLKPGEDATFIGVAVDNLAGEAANSVYLVLNNKMAFKTNYGGNSDGFAVHAKNPKYNRAGFRISIDYEKFEQGVNEIKVIIVGKGGKYKFAPLRVYRIVKE